MSTQPFITTNKTGRATLLALVDDGTLADAYAAVRQATVELCQPLETEDFVIQSMTNTSPTRWHLAHTTWFFETLVLATAVSNYRMFHPEFRRLFNSYYNTVGDPFPRARRGLLSRPTVKEVFAYRSHVDEHMTRILDCGDSKVCRETLDTVLTGLHHERQHQELMLTDIKHAFSCNPLRPTYRRLDPAGCEQSCPLRWIDFEGGVRSVGHDENDFCYDNEQPRHSAMVHAFQLANRLVTNAEYLEFIEDGGYRNPHLWLSDGWAAVQADSWRAPLYWEERSDGWWQFTLGGMCPITSSEPVCHVSYYEADAFARWYGACLPTEFAWEIASNQVDIEGNFLERATLRPTTANRNGTASKLEQMFGDLWEWTLSPYVAYPGYRPPAGALGEYNGKFMANQMVLRGGSCVSAQDHIRRTYRNFAQPRDRWQFTGIRLAKDCSVRRATAGGGMHDR